MSETTLFRLAGWSAYFNAVLFISNMVTLLLFFALGGFWGSLNDGLSVLWALSFLPLAMMFYQLHRSLNPAISLAVNVIGMAAMFSFAILQALLVIGIVRFEQTFSAVLILGGLIGFFVLANGLFIRTGHTLPSGLSWFMIVYGISTTLTMVGFWLGGQEHPLTTIGFLIGGIAGPIWSIWLGRIVLSGELILALA